MKITLDNGWSVQKDTNGEGILHITPIPNTLFRKEQFVTLPAQAMEAIENGETRMKELFKQFNLYNHIFKWVPGKLPTPQPDTPDLFHGNGFILSKENGKYFFEYLLSRQGGGSEKIEVTKQIFEKCSNKEITVSSIFKKYNLYEKSKEW